MTTDPQAGTSVTVSQNRDDVMLKKMDELEGQLKLARGVRTFSVDSSFIKAIQIAPGQVEATMPNLSIYDGRGDLYEHLTKYESVMTHFGHNDIALCRLFTSTLKSSAKAWFRTLKPRSIENFAQLKDFLLVGQNEMLYFGELFFVNKS